MPGFRQDIYVFKNHRKIYIVKKTINIRGKRMYFKAIRKTEHYKENHEKDFPWSRVIEIILTARNPRKNDNKIEIKTDKYYILCELKDNILWVINAKYIK